jgi:hypothetical protein
MGGRMGKIPSPKIYLGMDPSKKKDFFEKCFLGS